MMKDVKSKADRMREERRRQMMKFIEKKKMRILSAQTSEKSPLRENKNISAPYQKKEEKPKEVEKTYINGSSRRKKRREKLAEIAAKREELKRQKALVLQQEKQKRLEERKKRAEEENARRKEAAVLRNEERNRRKLEALKSREEGRLRKEREKKARMELAAEKSAAAKLAKEEKKQAREKIFSERSAAVKLAREQKNQVREKLSAEKLGVAESAGEGVSSLNKSLRENRNDSSLKKREELFARLNSIKEKQNLEYQQKLLRKQLLLAEQKVSVMRRKEEKANKRAEALKIREDAAALRDSKKREALKAREEVKLRREQEKKDRAELAAEKSAAANLAKEQEKQAREKISAERSAAAKLAREQKEQARLTKPVAESADFKYVIEPAGAKEAGIAAVSDSLPLRRKEELLEFIRTRKLLNEHNAERRKALKSVAEERRAKVVPVPVPVPVSKFPVVEKAPVPAKAAMPAVSKDDQKRISGHIAGLVKEAGKINNAAVKSNVGQSIQSAQKFISGFRKKPAAEKKPVLVRPAKRVAKYREPFLLVPFIRKNAFKFVFLLLCIGWFAEIVLLIRGFQDPQQRLKSIVGEDLSADKTSKDKQVTEEARETEKFVINKPERIDIEGKRDPFSPGRLTMDVLDRPQLTNIVLAPRPEVISILRPVKAVSVIRGEKQMEPERVADVTKPQAPSYQTILRSSPSAGVPGPATLAPLEKVQAPEPSPLIMPEKRCDLVYRGRMLVEGVEYLFMEGRQKTYRVTVGDVVEGFRILRKEGNKLHLSKDGILYEISLD